MKLRKLLLAAAAVAVAIALAGCPGPGTTPPPVVTPEPDALGLEVTAIEEWAGFDLVHAAHPDMTGHTGPFFDFQVGDVISIRGRSVSDSGPHGIGLSTHHTAAAVWIGGWRSGSGTAVFEQEFTISEANLDSMADSQWAHSIRIRGETAGQVFIIYELTITRDTTVLFDLVEDILEDLEVGTEGAGAIFGEGPAREFAITGAGGTGDVSFRVIGPGVTPTPTITTQPANRDIPLNASGEEIGSLSVVAEDAPAGVTKSFQWQIEGGDDWVDIEDATGATLALAPHIDTSDLGTWNFRVIVTFTRGDESLPTTSDVARVRVVDPDAEHPFDNLPTEAATVDLTGIAVERILFNTAVATDVAVIAPGTMVTDYTADGNFIIAAYGFNSHNDTIFTITVPTDAAVGDVIHVAGRKGSDGGDGNIYIGGVRIAQGGGTGAGQFQTSEPWVRAITLTQGMIDDGISIIINAWGGGTSSATRLNDIGFELAIDQIVVIETLDPYITQRTALQNAITAAQRLVQQAYTDATWTPFATALAAAVTGVTDEAAGAGGRMDGLRTALTGAQTALVVDACEYWQEVLDDFMDISATHIGSGGTAVLAVRAGIVVYNIQQQWEGPGLDITAMRALNPGEDIVVTGTMTGTFSWGPRFDLGPIQSPNGTTASITVASDATELGNSRLVSNPRADSFIITTITVGDTSILYLLD